MYTSTCLFVGEDLTRFFRSFDSNYLLSLPIITLIMFVILANTSIVFSICLELFSVFGMY